MIKTDKIISIITFLGAAFAIIAMFSDILFDPVSRIISKADGELFNIFLPYREFAFSRLSGFDLPLWNPFVACGTPFFANIETGMLYPPNWINVVLNAPAGTNLNVIFHLILAAGGMYLWGRARGQKPLGGAVSAWVLVFSAPFFLLVYTGALSNLTTLAWAPIMFFAAKKLLDKKDPLWIFPGVLGGSMQIFAGHIQLFFYTQIVLVIYFVSGLCSREYTPKDRSRLAGQMIFMYAAVFGVTAIQLLPALSVLGEVVRGEKLTFEFASLFSFPPENLIMLIVPDFFGHLSKFPYWGRWFLWEVIIFAGLGSMIFAVSSAFFGDRSDKRKIALMVIICTVLAMGSYTPVFSVLFRYMPGFDLFRGASKFIFLTAMFLAALAGDGAEWVVSGKGDCADRRALKKAAYASGALALVLFCLACVIKSPFSGQVSELWNRFFNYFPMEEKQQLFRLAKENPRLIKDAGVFARGGVLYAAFTAIVFAGSFLLAVRWKKMRYVLVALVVVEVGLFAYSYRVFNVMPEASWPQEVREFFEEHPGDYRVFWPGRERENTAMVEEVAMLWGQLPPLKRYSEFMFFTQGLSPDDAGGFLSMRQYNELYGMLRCRYIVVPEEVNISAYRAVFNRGGIKIFETNNYLPRVFLVEEWSIEPERDRVFREMLDEEFDPGQKVLLERSPGKFSGGRLEIARRVEITEEGMDDYVVAVSSPEPAMLVITDAYAEGWIAEGVSSKERYNVVPANYTLMAIPIDAGEHSIRLKYLPKGFVFGRGLSVGSIAVLLIIALYLMLKRGRKI